MIIPDIGIVLTILIPCLIAALAVALVHAWECRQAAKRDADECRRIAQRWERTPQ